MRSDAQKSAEKKYDSKRAGTRSRNFLFIAYPDDLPDNWVDMINDTHVRWVEGPYHDKDVWTAQDELDNPEHKEGEFKKIHKHCLLMFESPRNVEQAFKFLADIFGINEDGSISGIPRPKICSDRSGSVRYMCHLDHPSKAQYDFDDIVGHNGADPHELVKFSVSETLHKMINIEEIIDKYDIREYKKLCEFLRYERIDLYQLVATKNSIHFKAYVTSHRHYMRDLERDLSNAVSLMDDDDHVQD